MKAFPKLLLLIFGTLAIHKSASATAFVLIRTPGGYVLGADSRVVNENDVIQQPTCKINVFANTALILTGPTVGPSFNLRSIGIPILKRNGLGVLAKEAKLYRAASRNVEYQKEVGTLKAFGAGWAFVQFHRVIVREFQNKDGVPNMPIVPHDYNPGAFFGMGTTEFAFRVLLPHMNEIQTKDSAIKLVKQALESSARQEPKSVGPPYSLVYITAKGTSWIDKGSCN